VYGFRFRVWGLGLRVKGYGLWDMRLDFRGWVQGAGCRVQGEGCRVFSLCIGCRVLSAG
jgi:hypothetical protein